MAGGNASGAGDALEVIALGEVLVDYIQVERAANSPTDPSSPALFARAAGGAPANVAAALAALGVRSGLAAKVGDDAHGRYLLERLAAVGIDLRHVRVDPAYATTLAFAALDPATGELTYSFARHPGADLMLRPDELDLGAVARARVLHVGTLSLVADPARAVTLAAVEVAREHDVLVSCDVNLRPHAWPSLGDMRAAVDLLLPQVDALKVGAAELAFLVGGDDAGTGGTSGREEAGGGKIAAGSAHGETAPGAGAGSAADQDAIAAGAAELLARGPRLVAVTCGERGTHLATRAAHARTDACPVERVIDTAGAGDAFWGAALAWLLREARPHTPADLDLLDIEALLACAHHASAAASLSVERRGALGSAPTALQIAERLEAWGRGTDA